MENVVAVFTHNVVPLYQEASSASEQISQGLLGDTAQVLEQSDTFVRVRTLDDYTGWVRKIHSRRIQNRGPLLGLDTTFPNMQSVMVGSAFADVWYTPDHLYPQTKLVWGTRVTMLETVLMRFGSYAHVLLPSGSFDTPVDWPDREGVVLAETLYRPNRPEEFDGRIACELAHRFIGTPYLWGGGTPFGFDCSGFVQRIYAVGITIPRDAYLQAQSPLGTFHEPGKTLRAGDLVFFIGQSDPRGRGITHVGMALDNKSFIHATGKTGVTHSFFDDPEVRDIYTYRGSWRVRMARVKAAKKV